MFTRSVCRFGFVHVGLHPSTILRQRKIQRVVIELGGWVRIVLLRRCQLLIEDDQPLLGAGQYSDSARRASAKGFRRREASSTGRLAPGANSAA